MNQYQHYSFDLWLTLIKSNPLFKQERTRFFYTHFNPLQKPEAEVGRIFRKVDLMCNAINEKTGGNIDAEEMYLMVINEISDFSHSFDNIDLPALYQEMESLVLRYLPVVYCSQTMKVLQQLKQNPDTTVSLLSNTAFIKGSTLRKVLQQLELSPYLDFQLYSDEVGMSKPNAALFRLMLDTVAANRQQPAALADIIHIGDNKRADILGADAMGIATLLINSNHQCISTLLN
ncbi:HAD family hydrolase [Chitinophaga eiseniae]|uniref:HAD family hydrolase n=2 Tax=Chitinophaga eiseniae TaxID=634771 RepID=A0A847SJ97_9BACT|nr:HAD family hydrolase [Chitinophaga eiseniae]